jgi:hypothetical protein
MPTLVTIVLDSGAFLQNIDEDPSELEIGYFQCGKDHDGKDVPDIRAYADGGEARVRVDKLGKGRIDVLRSKGVSPAPELTIADSLKRNLLRKIELYGKPSPDYNRSAFDCIIHFTSGDFRCSRVKNRRFFEARVSDHSKTGAEKHIRPIAHDVIVHFLLDDGEELSIERQGGPVLFSTTDIKPGTGHVEIELLANNATATQFFCDALDLAGRTTCWLPNQGDPTSHGMP